MASPATPEDRAELNRMTNCLNSVFSLSGRPWTASAVISEAPYELNVVNITPEGHVLPEFSLLLTDRHWQLDIRMEAGEVLSRPRPVAMLPRTGWFLEILEAVCKVIDQA
jgi:hypothetical protein